MIPVTVLTGYLGSGKTTLLANLLRTPEFARTAVIINEFGEVGIDHDLVETSEESFVELETGCLCCTVRGDLEATLADLVARREAGSIPAFERIVVETSGLADPAPLVNAIMAETGRGSGILLDGIVTTVDAVNGLATLAREPQSMRQVAVADRLILTKTDLLPDGPDHALMAEITRLNPRAQLAAAEKGSVEPLFLVANPDGAPNPSDWNIADAETAPPAEPRHDNGVTCIAIHRRGPIPALALTLLLETLAEHLGADLLRLKAIVHVAEHPSRPAVLHGVQHVFHEPEWLTRWPSDDRTSRFVLIGRNLSRLWFDALVDAVIAEVGEVAIAPRPPAP